MGHINMQANWEIILQFQQCKKELIANNIQLQFSLPVIESQVGLQNGSTKTITAEVEVSLAPKQVVHWYVRPIIKETTVYLDNLKVGFASEVLTFDDKVEDWICFLRNT